MVDPLCHLDSLWKQFIRVSEQIRIRIRHEKNIFFSLKIWKDCKKLAYFVNFIKNIFDFLSVLQFCFNMKLMNIYDDYRFKRDMHLRLLKTWIRIRNTGYNMIKCSCYIIMRWNGYVIKLLHRENIIQIQVENLYIAAIEGYFWVSSCLSVWQLKKLLGNQ